MESADNREQPTASNKLSKIETLKLLNDSIDELEEVIESINASASNNLPPATAMNTLVATTKKLATAVTNPPTVTPTPVAPPPLATPLQEAVSSSPEAIKTKPLAAKASQIPNKASKNKTLGLIGIGISAIAVIIVAVFWLWLPKHPMGFSANPQSIDTEDTEIVTTTTTDEINPEATEIRETPPISPEQIPTEIPSNTNTSEESLTADGENLELESPAEIPIPQDIVSPGRPKDLKVTIIEPEQLQLTPEQTLVAALQTKVAEILKDYPEDLLNSVEVDFGQHSLVVKVSDLWYKLNESRQTKLANQILERSRKLNLTKLELNDIGGTLVARSPVVGNQVIILQTTKENTELPE
jgi:hypothetical protein